MFKFFREYQKRILAVGITFLMVAFLIQPTLSMFQPNPLDEVLGTIGSDQVTVADMRGARAELVAIQGISPVLRRLAARDELQWVLMLGEAEQMGLSASNYQVDALIDQINRIYSEMGGDPVSISAVAAEIGLTQGQVRQALARWLAVQHYKELVTGLEHISADERLIHFLAAGQYLQMGYFPGVGAELAATRGRPRTSEPMRRWFQNDQHAGVKITATAVGIDEYLDQAPEPDAAALTELFEQFKDDEPGEGQPYGFGYRIPDQVRIEYLWVPQERARKAVQIEEAEALAYYDENQDQFPASDSDTASEGPTPLAESAESSSTKTEPYERVRSRIIERLRDEHAVELCTRMIKTARAMLLEDARSLPQKGGYSIPAEGWQPIPLSEVANRLQEQFGVQADVRRHDNRWLTHDDITLLPGLGTGEVVTSRRARLVDYVFSSKPFIDALPPVRKKDQNPQESQEEPESFEDNVRRELAILRLQDALPSLPIRSFDGSRYLFRVIESRPARSPDTLAEVHGRVAQDAKALAAYRLLLADRDRWLATAKQDGITAVAESSGGPVLSPDSFVRRPNSRQGDMSAPDIDGVGSSEDFVSAVFNLATSFEGGVALASATPADRTLAVGVDAALSLYLVRIDRYEPMTRRQYKQTPDSTTMDTLILQAVVGDAASDALADDALYARTSFSPNRGEQDE